MLRTVWCLAAIGVVSCGGTTSTDEETDSGIQVETDSAAPSAYIFEAEETELLLTASDIEAAITEGIITSLTLDPAPLHEAYQQVRAEGDDDCPYYNEDYYDAYGYYYWYDTCTTTAGSEFSGYAISYDKEGYEASGYIYSPYRYFSGNAKVVTSDGHTFEGAGNSTYYEWSREDGVMGSYHYANGTFRWDGSSEDENWLDDNYAGYIYLSGVYYPTYPGVYLSYSVSLSGLTGSVNTIIIDGAFIYSESMGSMCTDEPSGTISVRNDNGDWYDVTFDGPQYWGGAVFPPSCDGCGNIYQEGVYLGQACPDFSVLLDWDDRPW